MVFKDLIILSFFLFSYKSMSCSTWSSAKLYGNLNSSVLDEASGIAVSRRLENTMYHINDSGGGAYLYKSDYKGQNLKKIKVIGAKFKDTEDLSIVDKMIYIADIGDNRVKRKKIKLIVIDEDKISKDEVKADRVISLKYPDGPHNAESLIVHPRSQKIYIFTKEVDGPNINKSVLYSISLKEINDFKKDFYVLKKVAILDLLQFFPKLDKILIVSAAVHPQGDRFLLLSYEFAIEFMLDLDKVKSKSFEGFKNYKIINLIKTPQQEAITYGSDGKTIYYTSEASFFFKKIGPYRLECRK